MVRKMCTLRNSVPRPILRYPRIMSRSVQQDTLAPAEDLHFARQERLRFLETMLLWNGSVTRREVSEAFGISLNHVSRDINVYQQQYPDNLAISPKTHTYIAGPKFSPMYASGDPAEHLGLLQTRAETGSVAIVPLVGGAGAEVATLPSPALGIDRNVLAAVLRAIRLQQGLQLIYHSLQAGQPERHAIWPHALLNTGVRWYARAYDDVGQKFRDFALSRMERPEPHTTPSPEPRDVDVAWMTQVHADVIPHPKLNAHQQRVVAHEFAMKRERTGWVWSLELRQALVGYFAHRYGLDAKYPPNPDSQWIVLRNRKELKPFFLTAGRE